MRIGSEMLLQAMTKSVIMCGAQGHAACPIGKIDWRLKSRRIEHKDRANVLSIACITIMPAARNRGYMTEVIQNIIDTRQIAGRPVDWVYFEQCRFRLANHLHTALGFTTDFGMVIDAWRRTGNQLELSL